MWGIRGWRSYAPAMGYHEPQNGRLGFGVCASATPWVNSNTPPESVIRTTLYFLYTSRCTGELNAIRKQNAFSAVLSTEGRVVGLCWAKLKSKGPEESPLLPKVNRGSTFALRRPTLAFCLGEQRSLRAFHQDKRHSRNHRAASVGCA